MYASIIHILFSVVVPLVANVSAPASQPTSRSSTATVDDLRRFEEASFPKRQGQLTPPLTPTRQPRPSAENPPAELRSADHRPERHRTRKPPRRWLSKLVLPDIPVTWDEKLIRYLEFYRSHPRGRALMRLLLQRKGRFGSMIARTLKKYGLPQALTHVAMIESAYNPGLTSRVGAAGLWQFMRHSGRAYGLHRDHWIDERRNPERSTDAAARHLKDLKHRFGTWELALAAYNAGSGMIIAAMQKYNTNDYWQLCRYESGLPWSTSLYVPKILATAIVSANREFFGFGDVTFDPEFEYQLVSVPRSIALSKLARAADVDLDTLRELNPELRRNRTRPGKSWVRVPRTCVAERFYSQLTTMKLTRYRPYLVRLGDTPDAIAKQHRMSLSALRQINGLGGSETLRAGLTILLPAKPRLLVATTEEKQQPKAPSASAAAVGDAVVVALPEGVPEQIAGRRRVFYQVVIGDKLDEIARQLHVSALELARWNGLNPRGRLVSEMVLQAFVAEDFDTSKVRLLPRKRIQLMVAGSEPFLDQHEQSKGRQRLTYTVRKNDTLSRVARRFGLSVGSVMRINKLSRSARLQAGQKIIVYTKKKKRRRRSERKTTRSTRAKAAAKPKPKVAKAKAKLAPIATRKSAVAAARPRSYTVRQNDNLIQIGRRFGLSVAELKRLNKLTSSTLQIGQKLIVSNDGSSKARTRKVGGATN